MSLISKLFGGDSPAVENMAGRTGKSAAPGAIPPQADQGMYEAAKPRQPLQIETDTPHVESGSLKVTHVAPQPKPALDLSRVPFPTPQQDKAFLKYAISKGFKIPGTVLEKLRDLDQVFTRLEQGLRDYSPQAAKDAYFHSLATTAESIGSGDASVKDANHSQWSLAEWQDDYGERKKAISLKRREISLQARNLALPGQTHLNSQ